MRRRRCKASAATAIAAILVLAAPPASAYVDIFDRGPALTAGKFNLRVTNAGLVGNPFPNLSFDPSFEYPKGSGQELLRSAALWVGALDVDGVPRVSGGPLLEFRPTLARDDTVRQVWHGRLGSQRSEDDDGDGRIDEEVLNHRDDDGDGEVDEDLGVIGQQMLAAEYTDDQPESGNSQQGSGESHHPLGLSVHQEAYAWSWPGYDGIAGLHYTITNHGGATLRDVYLGLYADLDAAGRGELAGYLNDAIGRVSFSRSVFKGVASIRTFPVTPQVYVCFDQAARTLPFVEGPPDRSSLALPVVTVLPLGHTMDPLAVVAPQVARAPYRDTFRASVFAGDRSLGVGSPPFLDEQRYAALKGEWPQSPDTHVGDQHVLVSCGPFRTLAPGQSLDFSVALVAAPRPESLQVALGNAAFLYHGVELNLLPDVTGPQADFFAVGETGLNGHEVCVEVPEGIEVRFDPHCQTKFDDDHDPGTNLVTYRHGTCVWTDADCDACTGMRGRETVIRWVDLHHVPPSPTVRVTPGDRDVRIEWDNLPEILISAGKTGPRGGRFLGYRLYRLEDWRDRGSLMPARERWAALGTWGYDSTDSKKMLSAITDSTLDYLRLWYEQEQYPVGRYGVTDLEPRNGFDYVYMVTTVVELRTQVTGGVRIERFESPIVATFDERVVPRTEARADAKGVWVVPNPFRVSADWDRPPVYGDRLTRHLDFMGLPRARCTIRIWTVAGDHVATVEHDGTKGSGQASWDLVSRNGQEVSSGVYLYTVESTAGSSTGRFVVIR